MKRIKTDLLHGVIWQQILLFFFPVLFGTVIQQLYNTVDAMIVGNFIGKEALGAVGGSTGTLINLLVGFVTGLASGATVIIAQYYGSAESDGVRRGVYSGMALAVGLGAILMAAGIFLAPSLLRLLNVPDDILPLSISYMRIFLSGMIPTMIYNTGASVLRAAGDSRRPLLFLIISCIANIILDILFVAVFNAGVEGAAAATVLSQCISCVLTLYVLGHTHESYHFDFHHFSADMTVLKRIISIGFPIGMQAVLYSVANLFIQASINSYGTDTIAAYTAFGKIDALFWNTSAALGTALLTFCGQNFGAGDIKRVKKGIREGIVIYLLITGLITFVCYAFGDFFYGLFTKDTEVIRIGTELLRYLCPFWACFVFVEIFSSSIRACGDSFVPMVITAVGIGAFRILWILFWPASTIFDTLRCYPISWTLTSLLFLGYYLQGGWLKRSMRRRESLFNAS